MITKYIAPITASAKTVLAEFAVGLSRQMKPGVQHRNPPPPDLKNKEIYFIDFVYKPEVMRQIVAENKKVMAIDHHVTAKESIALAHESSYEMEKSGSVLAWEYFHPGQAVPRLLLYIQDNDLWSFKVPYSRELFMYLHTVPWDFKEWKRVMTRLEKADSRNNFIEKGKAILAFEAGVVDSLVRNSAELVEFEGRKIYAVNSPIAVSELGHALAKKQPPMALIWSERDGRVVVSMRSTGRECGAVATKYGGRGHGELSLDVGEPKPWK